MQQQLAAHPGVEALSFSSGEPSFNSGFAPFSAPDRGIDKDDVTEIKYVDENYTDMFGLTMLAGEKMSRRDANDTLHHVVVNETLPVAYYVMHNWLENFAYHISIGAGVFLVAIIASFVIAALTIASQTIKAALANPVKALRSE